jgi:hypothetical protein
MVKLSSQSLDALAEVISGGSANAPGPSIGLYRAGYQIERFMADANLAFSLGGASRVPGLRAYLDELRNEPGGHDALVRLIERVADPRDYIRAPEKGQAVLSHLNLFLEYDELEVVIEGRRARVRKKGATSVVVNAFANKTMALNFEAVQREVDRALESAERDPPVAVTAACVIIESVCRSILAELKIDPPSKRDVEGLLRAVQEPLGLLPGRSDLPDLIAADIRQVLGGLTSVAKGVGALRTHGGSAHATEHGQAPVDARIARFAIHSASTIALFLVETWERKQRRDQKLAMAAASPITT